MTRSTRALRGCLWGGRAPGTWRAARPRLQDRRRETSSTPRRWPTRPRTSCLLVDPAAGYRELEAMAPASRTARTRASPSKGPFRHDDEAGAATGDERARRLRRRCRASPRDGRRVMKAAVKRLEAMGRHEQARDRSSRSRTSGRTRRATTSGRRAFRAAEIEEEAARPNEARSSPSKRMLQYRETSVTISSYEGRAAALHPCDAEDRGGDLGSAPRPGQGRATRITASTRSSRRPRSRDDALWREAISGRRTAAPTRPARARHARQQPPDCATSRAPSTDTRHRAPGDSKAQDATLPPPASRCAPTIRSSRACHTGRTWFDGERVLAPLLAGLVGCRPHATAMDDPSRRRAPSTRARPIRGRSSSPRRRMDATARAPGGGVACVAPPLGSAELRPVIVAVHARWTTELHMCSAYASSRTPMPSSCACRAEGGRRPRVVRDPSGEMIDIRRSTLRSPPHARDSARRTIDASMVYPPRSRKARRWRPSAHHVEPWRFARAAPRRGRVPHPRERLRGRVQRRPVGSVCLHVLAGRLRRVLCASKSASRRSGSGEGRVAGSVRALMVPAVRASLNAALPWRDGGPRRQGGYAGASKPRGGHLTGTKARGVQVSDERTACQWPAYPIPDSVR